MAGAPTRIAAFDVDGTIVPGQSQEQLVALLVRKGEAPPLLLLRVLWWATLYRLGVELDFQAIQRRVVSTFTGVPQHRLDRIFDALLSEKLVPALRPGAVAEIARRREQGCAIVLLSASLSPIIGRLAGHLGADGHVATDVAPGRAGLFSGVVEGARVAGPEKLRRLARFADAAYGNWELFAAYGDHVSDEPLLAAARHPCAVSPTAELAALARTRNWRVEAW